MLGFSVQLREMKRRRIELENDEDMPDNSDLDFRSFVSEPCSPYDITVTNQRVEFRAHKNVLRKISTVFGHIIDGDYEIKELPMNDICD